MNLRRFGKTDLFVSEVGFGAWAIGGGAMVGDTAIGWGEADDRTSQNAIFKALDQGINFFDTADIYGLGHSEELIGKMLGNREDVIVASKVGNVAREGKFGVDYSKQHILEACDASLKRLRRDAIDYYQLHTARLTHLQQEDCIGAMQMLQKHGKIRNWGISLNTYEPFPEAEYLIENKLVDGFQLVLNILNQTALPLIKRASEAGYGIIARMPLQFGLLTGKFDSGAEFADNDHRNNRLTPAVIQAYKEAVTKIWPLCEKYGLTKTELALSYILSYPEVSTVIPGIRTEEQAIKNTKGLTCLEKEDLQLIENADLDAVMKIIKQQG
ncbi:aldo/keto reductase [Salinimicrobium terrae]|uniref:aldo/keto reductase n=1 Tax=Salinimicrobium terrae TaxID=470866 RepID=UPI000414DC77|nr:aldo/keto reductase [Salinimicrobium terrae]